MARLSPKKDVLRDLAISSRNQCAFPRCDHPLLDSEGVYVAELCHIEAAEPGGERYNPSQSDEQRRGAANLLFLCHKHHKITDDVELYPVSRMRQIKSEHEALPEVVFNAELLLERLEEVRSEQAEIRNILDQTPQPGKTAPSYAIVGPQLREAWTPEVGRFYETKTGENTSFNYMMRDGWLHIEQQLEDGAKAYYEVNENGSVRKSSLPYPIDQYRVVIPENLILSRERASSQVGTYAIKTELKWSLGSVTEHFIGTSLAGVDCDARCGIDQKNRTISVIGATDA